jgi:ribosomal protein S18 acetylase RimI-like enzyme
MDIIIKPLSPDLLDDYLFFFDNMTFTENPDWSKCYCYSFHFTGLDEQWNGKENRKAVIELIKADKLRGYLAYSKNKPIGWCNVNDRNNYQRLKSAYKLSYISGEKICSIVCFLVSPEFRRKGIATMLLERIIKDYAIRDYDFLEAYPLKSDLSSEKNYKGPFSLYECNDFKISKEYDKYYVVRKRINGIRVINFALNKK